MDVIETDTVGSNLELTDAKHSTLALTAGAAALGLLAGCGGGSGGASVAANVPSLPQATYNDIPSSDQEAARFLLQAQFSASDVEIASVKSSGYASWLATQIKAPAGQTGIAWLDTYNSANLANATRSYSTRIPADSMIWSQLMGTSDAPRKRMALALSEIFVSSINNTLGNWRPYVVAAYWDILCANAFGNYRTLLEDMTLNLAMGNYLNTRGNKKADGKGSAPDENYAREVMQLFTIGLVKLNPDGTPQLQGGESIETYSNTDVSELAKVFTGYDIDNSQSTIPPFGDGFPSNTFARLRMVQAKNGIYRSSGSATFLGTTIDNVSDVAASLRTALDALFNHPSNAPFISKQLIQRLVTSNPSAAYVQRVANIYANNGNGMRGDLGAVYAAILRDNEARSSGGLTDIKFGKLREPMLRLVQWARTFNVKSEDDTWMVGDLSDPGTELGQSPLRSPSVFNFFRPGYVPPGTNALSPGAVAPEFQLVSESSVAGYLNYMQGVIDRGINRDMKAKYTDEIALTQSPSAANPVDLINHLNLLLAAGQLSLMTVTMITNTIGGMSGTVVNNVNRTNVNLRLRVCAAVLMVMASAEYLIQK